MIKRSISNQIQKRMNDKKVIIILGPSQVGETILVKNEFAEQLALWLNGDDLDVRTHVSNPTRYIDLLEKTFMVSCLASFSRNLRNELKQSRKIYFHHVDIRNSVIKNWNSVNFRAAIRSLWEIFLIGERMKYKIYHNLFPNDYFWRTTTQQEIDFIEDYKGIIHAYEFKWNPKIIGKFSTSFRDAYAEHKLMIVNLDNYLDFIKRN